MSTYVLDFEATQDIYPRQYTKNGGTFKTELEAIQALAKPFPSRVYAGEIRLVLSHEECIEAGYPSLQNNGRRVLIARRKRGEQKIKRA